MPSYRLDDIQPKNGDVYESPTDHHFLLDNSALFDVYIDILVIPSIFSTQPEGWETCNIACPKVAAVAKLRQFVLDEYIERVSVGWCAYTVISRNKCITITINQAHPCCPSNPMKFVRRKRGK